MVFKFFSFLRRFLCRWFYVAKFTKRTKLFFGTLLFVVTTLVVWTHKDDIYYFGYRSFHWLSYGSRPVWDTSEISDLRKIKFFGHPRLNYSSPETCKLFGWTQRKKPVQIFDAVIFSIELDLLEIRLGELHEVVDKFIILESDLTFTGNKKQFVLQNSLKETPGRFDFAKSKISLRSFTYDNIEQKDEEPFARENHIREQMSSFLKVGGVQAGDIVIMADVDEIPRKEVIQLYRLCEGMPSPLHLEMKRYIYSFGNLLSKDPSWRPAIHVYQPHDTYYSHGKKSSDILEDSGWHCSFCFPRISDVRFKMTSYSHSERAYRHPSLLESRHIQQQICSGIDVYNFVPEAYTFKDLFLQIVSGADKITSYWDIPIWPILNKNRFEWILPAGNCTREE